MFNVQGLNDLLKLQYSTFLCGEAPQAIHTMPVEELFWVTLIFMGSKKTQAGKTFTRLLDFVLPFKH